MPAVSDISLPLRRDTAVGGDVTYPVESRATLLQPDPGQEAESLALRE